MSWLWRGTQSAIFFYLSCVPCSEFAYRRRRRKNAARSKAEKETDQDPYPHPAPFSTNAYWREEITMGPGPPQKNGKVRREQERKRWGGRGTNDKENQRGLMTGNSADTGASSADTVVARDSLQGVAELDQQRRSGDNWNRRRYQREDEILWGFDDTSEDGAGGGKDYTNVRNPSVNDLHPPVVSTISTNRSETRWMLQPPPSAKIMEGKVQASRSRSTSGGSNGSSKRGGPGLGRQLGERTMEEKRRKGQTSQTESPAMSRVTMEEKPMSNATKRGQRHDRDPDHARLPRKSTESQSSSGSKQKAGVPSPNITHNDSRTSDRLPPSTSMTKPLAEYVFPAQRPQLQSIISSTAISPVQSSPKSPTKQSPHLRPPLRLSTPSTSSLRALQEFSPPSAALNSQRPVSMPPSSATRVGLPPPDAQEDEALEIPEVETFWPSEYKFGATEVEDRRQQRWSMDI
ncbi:MAG: hypothetical protein L6R42_002052 [Xanthoria sp. 1 TBL-2021]|nr:MAG: hypothetical protein L6R42_002052 [Xanthoria sp. 1 TBL-2021]